MCWGSKTPTPSASGAGACPPGSTAPCPLDCPTKVEFKEHSSTAYGFDGFTDAAVPWKSVEKGKTDKVVAEITPSAKFANAAFKSSDTAKVTVSPAAAASATQEVTVTGVDNGESTVSGTCGGSELGKMKVKTYTKKTKTVAVRLVHSKSATGYAGYTSTDIADATITSFLKKVYDQAVFEFALTRLSAKTVYFDINKDSKVDVGSWMSAEMRKIRDACKDDSYDYNIFLVDNPSDGSFGFMDFNQRYGFVHPGGMTNPQKSFAHELGHGAFGMTHETTDSNNNMSQGDSADKWRLRKHQWDRINP